MGYQFKRHSQIDPFVIDQTMIILFGQNQFGDQLLQEFYDQLQAHGGTAGFLGEEAPSGLSDVDVADAILLSTENELE